MPTQFLASNGLAVHLVWSISYSHHTGPRVEGGEGSIRAQTHPSKGLQEKHYCNSKKWSYYDGECVISGTLLLDLLTLLVQLCKSLPISLPLHEI